MKVFALLILIFIVLFVGYIWIFSVQHLLYIFWATPNIKDLDDWYRSQYSPGATIVFVLSILATLIWFGIALYFNDKDRRPSHSRMTTLWAILWALPALSIPLALSQLREGQDTSAWLLILYLLDAVWLFWFASAISTPEAFKFVIPGSFWLRKLLQLFPCFK